MNDAAEILRMPREYQPSYALAVALRELRADPGTEAQGEADHVSGCLLQETLGRLGWEVVPECRSSVALLRAQVSALGRLLPVAAAAADAAEAPWWRRGKALRRLRQTIQTMEERGT